MEMPVSLTPSGSPLLPVSKIRIVAPASIHSLLVLGWVHVNWVKLFLGAPFNVPPEDSYARGDPDTEEPPGHAWQLRCWSLEMVILLFDEACQVKRTLSAQFH